MAPVRECFQGRSALGSFAQKFRERRHRPPGSRLTPGGEELGEPRAPRFLGSFYLFYEYGAFCRRNVDQM